jgi:pimeloyl-ACP methyl ester carboxylesterase
MGSISRSTAAATLVVVGLGFGATATSGQTMIEEARIEAGGFVFDGYAAGPVDGPVVFLLHGFPQGGYEWRHQLPVLAEMGFRAIAPNQRGYSAGARPSGVEAYATQNMVDDLIAMANAVGADRFHVVGHDWGAVVTWFAGLRHPNRVISLVPMSVPHPFAFSQALADPQGEQAQMSSYFETFRSDDAEDLFLANDAAMLRGIFGSLPADEAQVYVDLLGTPDAIGAALNWYRAMNLGPGANPITPIRMPTMYIWSTGDTALGREGAEMTADFVEGPYRFEVLEGVSHWVPEEAADRVNELLQEHFAPYRP